MKIQENYVLETFSDLFFGDVNLYLQSTALHGHLGSVDLLPEYKRRVELQCDFQHPDAKKVGVIMQNAKEFTQQILIELPRYPQYGCVGYDHHRGMR